MEELMKEIITIRKLLERLVDVYEKKESVDIVFEQEPKLQINNKRRSNTHRHCPSISTPRNGVMFSDFSPQINIKTSDSEPDI